MSPHLTYALTTAATAWKREVSTYFATPLAYIFLAIFLSSIGLFTWDISGFFEAGKADLDAFFSWHPWLYIFFMPALAMRLWSDEKLLGTIELLNSLPVSLSGLVTGKLLAAWTVAGAGLVMTLPWWIMVNYLGDTDNGVIAVSYLMSWLMAGAFLGIGSTVSALTSSSAIAFVLSVGASFLITAAGWPILSVNIDSVFGPALSEIVSQFSFMTHFSPAQRGVVELRNIIFFLSFIGLSIAATRLLIEYRRRVPK